MKIIFKYLKPFAFSVFLCLVLLFVQAVSDLSLPNYMSDIVNVGVQGNGISETTPKVMSENAFQLVSLFSSETDANIVKDSYTLTAAGTADKKIKDEFSKTETQSVYVLKSLSKENYDKVSSVYSTSTLAFIDYMKTAMPAGANQSSSNSSKGTIDAAQIQMIYKYLPMLSKAPKQTFEKSIQTAKDTDSKLKSQISTTFTSGFYTELGGNLGDIQRRYIILTGLKMLLLTLVSAIATVMVGFLASRVAASVSKIMRRDIFKKVSSFSNAEFDKFSTASLITRTTNDITQVQMLVVMGIRMMLYAPIMGVGGIIMAVNKSPSLSWLIALGVGIILFIIGLVLAIAMPKFKMLQKLIDRLNLVSRENLSGLSVIRAFANEKHEEERFAKAAGDLQRTERFVQRTMAFMMPVMMFIMNGLSLLIIWVGGHAIANSTIGIGDLMAFIQYSMQIIMAFLMLAMVFILVPRASVSAVRIGEVLAVKPTIVDKKQPELIEKPKGEVTFHNVSFKYGGAEKDALSDISFVAKPGETTAIIGSTGSGKTTLINLIPRFYDATGGEVLFDGVNVKELSNSQLRDFIGYVPQKGMLFMGNIASNIRFGKETATNEEIEEAIDTAQAAEFVNSTEHGTESEISQSGGNVSGGQKQRLAIARALIKKPPVYIFDDSFSALDFQTDAALRHALKEKTGDSTVIIVAQRISTIMNAEQILVLDGGKVVGKGRHSELLRDCTVYREIAESQLGEGAVQ